MSTSPPNPVWMSYKDTKVVEEQLSFSLQRMTGGFWDHIFKDKYLEDVYVLKPGNVKLVVL